MIIRTSDRQHYVIIDNRTLEDHRLSWKARGILGYLLTKPDGWEVMTGQLVNAGPDGRDAVVSALHELETIGYLVRRGQARQDRGRFDTVETEVHESPTSGWPSSLVGTDAGFPSTGCPPRVARSRSNRSRKTNREQLPIPSNPEEANPEENNNDGSAVERLCVGLANHIEEHSGRRPKITKTWGVDMDRLLRLGPATWATPDPVPPGVVAGAITAIFTRLNVHSASGFCWADQIRSPGNLRDKWDRLAAAVRAAEAPPPAGHDPLRRGGPSLASLAGRAHELENQRLAKEAR